MKTILLSGFSLFLMYTAQAGVDPVGTLKCRVVDFDQAKVRLNCGTEKQPTIVSVPKNFFNEKFDLRPEAEVAVKRNTEELVRDIASASPKKGKVK